MTHATNPDYDLQYWGLDELQAALDAGFSELGAIRDQPETADRAFLAHFLDDRIVRIGTEMRKRIRGGQDLDAARVESRRYPPQLIEEIKNAYDLRDHIAHDLGLTKPIRGTISSPFRTDRSPSLSVTPEYFHDFGTGEGGDIIAWRMRFHSVTFRQAVVSLAAQAGIDIPEPPPKAGAPMTARPSQGDRPHAMEFRGGKMVRR